MALHNQMFSGILTKYTMTFLHSDWLYFAWHSVKLDTKDL